MNFRVDFPTFELLWSQITFHQFASIVFEFRVTGETEPGVLGEGSVYLALLSGLLADLEDEARNSGLQLLDGALVVRSIDLLLQQQLALLHPNQHLIHLHHHLITRNYLSLELSHSPLQLHPQLLHPSR